MSAGDSGWVAHGDLIGASAGEWDEQQYVALSAQDEEADVYMGDVSAEGFASLLSSGELTAEQVDGAVSEFAQLSGLPPWRMAEMAADAAGVLNGCQPEPWQLAAGIVALNEGLLLATAYSAAERLALAKQGHALADGSYPIANAEDLRNAARLAASKHGNWRAAQRLIRLRARELGVDVTTLPGFGQAASVAASGTAVALSGVARPWDDVDLSRSDLDIPEAAVQYYLGMAEQMAAKSRRFHGKAGSGRVVTSRTRAHHSDLEHRDGDISYDNGPPTVGPDGVYGAARGLSVPGLSQDTLDNPEIRRMFGGGRKPGPARRM